MSTSAGAFSRARRGPPGAQLLVAPRRAPRSGAADTAARAWLATSMAVALAAKKSARRPRRWRSSPSFARPPPPPAARRLPTPPSRSSPPLAGSACAAVADAAAASERCQPAPPALGKRSRSGAEPSSGEHQARRAPSSSRASRPTSDPTSCPRASFSTSTAPRAQPKTPSARTSKAHAPTVMAMVYATRSARRAMAPLSSSGPTHRPAARRMARQRETTGGRSRAAAPARGCRRRRRWRRRAPIGAAWRACAASPASRHLVEDEDGEVGPASESHLESIPRADEGAPARAPPLAASGRSPSRVSSRVRKRPATESRTRRRTRLFIRSSRRARPAWGTGARPTRSAARETFSTGVLRSAEPACFAAIRAGERAGVRVEPYGGSASRRGAAPAPPPSPPRLGGQLECTDAQRELRLADARLAPRAMIGCSRRPPSGPSSPRDPVDVALDATRPSDEDAVRRRGGRGGACGGGGVGSRRRGRRRQRGRELHRVPHGGRERPLAHLFRSSWSPLPRARRAAAQWAPFGREPARAARRTKIAPAPSRRWFARKRPPCLRRARGGWTASPRS